MTCEYNSAPYEHQLMKIGIRLGEPFKRAKEHHILICNHCGHQWSATPVSKLQAFKKRGNNGCPSCNKKQTLEQNTRTRQVNMQRLIDRGLEILSDWDGRNAIGKKCAPLPVTVKNIKCGHTFTSTAVNLLQAEVTCPICAREYKNSVLTASSKARSEEWQKTATDWKIYKSVVAKITRVNYRQHKHIINPDNLPTGRAGKVGAYHIDHIVPIRYCFNNNIPESVCAHFTNLQMLGWRENVGSRDKLKGKAPMIFKEYIR